MMKFFSKGMIVGSLLLLVVACLPLRANAPTAPIQSPVLVPIEQTTQQTTAPVLPTPRRILLIGSLFSQDIDIFLKGLVQAANPTAQLEVASMILPAT